MKKLLLLAIACSLFLISCGENLPAQTQVVPSATSTLDPSPTPIETLLSTEKPATPSATEKNVPTEMPVFMSEYLLNGYDKEMGSQRHMVLDEKSLIIKTIINNVDGKDFTIIGQMKIHYVENGVHKEGTILTDVCRDADTDDGSLFCFYLDNGSIFISPFVISEAAIKVLRTANIDWTDGNHPIIKVNFDTDIPGVKDIFEGVFPPFSGKIELITVPGIKGPVVPITAFQYTQKY